MGKLGKSIQAGLWLWVSTGSYWLLPTTINLLPPLAHIYLGASWPHLDTPILLFIWKDSVPLCQPCFYSSCPLGWFRHYIFIETPWLCGLGPVVPSTALHLQPCLCSCGCGFLLPEPASLNSRLSVLVYRCHFIVVFLMRWVGRRAQKWSKGWQGSVNSKEVTHISSYSVFRLE